MNGGKISFGNFIIFRCAEREMFSCWHNLSVFFWWLMAWHGSMKINEGIFEVFHSGKFTQTAAIKLFNIEKSQMKIYWNCQLLSSLKLILVSISIEYECSIIETETCNVNIWLSGQPTSVSTSLLCANRKNQNIQFNIPSLMSPLWDLNIR